MARFRLSVLLMAFTVLAAACAAGPGGEDGSAAPNGPEAARCEPEGVIDPGGLVPLDCAYEDLDGEVRTLAELADGRPLLVNFWASWCVFCIKEMPDFQRVYEDVGDRVEFVGMNLLGVDGESRDLAEQFAESTGVLYPLAYDEGGLLYSHFSLRRIMPLTLFVEPDGVLAFRQFGPVDARQLTRLLEEHLGIV